MPIDPSLIQPCGRPKILPENLTTGQLLKDDVDLANKLNNCADLQQSDAKYIQMQQSVKY